MKIAAIVIRKGSPLVLIALVVLLVGASSSPVRRSSPRELQAEDGTRGGRSPLRIRSQEKDCDKLKQLAESVEALPGRYIVGFKKDLIDGVDFKKNETLILEKAEAFFAEFPNETAVIKRVVAEVFPAFSFQLDNLPDVDNVTVCGVSLPAIVDLMLASKFVDVIEPEQLFTNQSSSYTSSNTDMEVSAQSSPGWNLDRIDQKKNNYDSLYLSTYNGTGVVAFIIDSGLRYTHEQFDDRASCGIDLIREADYCADRNGHGTHVAGTVGSRDYGVAKDVELVGVRTLDDDGVGSTSDIIAGVNWAVLQTLVNPAFYGASKKRAVINMSIGGGQSYFLNSAVDFAMSMNIFVAVAAGNENQDACNVSPASSSDVMTVGSTMDSDARSSFSNWGSCVDIFAPGSDILSTSSRSDTGTATLSGTSMASPAVAGVGALYLSSDPDLTADQVKKKILASATSGLVTDPGANSPNRLLNTEAVSGVTPKADSEPLTSAATRRTVFFGLW